MKSGRSLRRALVPILLFALGMYLIAQAIQPIATRKAARPAPKLTYSQLIERAEERPSSIWLVSFDPNKRQVTATLRGGDKVSVNYPSDQSQVQFQNLLHKHGINFDSKGVGGSSWWGHPFSLLPFVLLIFGFWIFLMNRMQGGGSKVMSFGQVAGEADGAGFAEDRL